jgi:di/tricarboxylate transporter
MEALLVGDIPHFQMWFTFVMIVAAIIGYSSDKIPLEITAIVIIGALLVFFHFFPVYDAAGENLLSTETLLAGFANPALIAVLLLLVLGQSIVQTGALNEVAGLILKFSRNNAFLALFIILFVVMVVSAFLNNTPVVVIFIPIVAALAKKVDTSVSKLMIPLSFASILGGMTTLIGSSTNLLVSGVMVDLGMEPLGFFDFTVIGSVLAGAGFIYILFIAPHLLPDRTSLARSVVGEDDSRKFVAQMEVDYGSDFVGKKVAEGLFEKKQGLTIRMVQRGEHAFLPPFEDDMLVRPQDLIVVSGGRKDIAMLYAESSKVLLSDEEASQLVDDDDEPLEERDTSMAEVVIAPASRMIGRNLEQIGFHRQYNCVVLGIQRQSRVIRARVTEIRLAAGDVLLVAGKQENILALHDSRDLLLLEWTTEDIRSTKMGKVAALIFFLVVGAAAFKVMPIIISAFLGVGAVLVTRILNLRQAVRSLDMKILLLVASSLGLGIALQQTGGALFLAQYLIALMDGASTPIILSAFFLLVAVLTNVLSNNASAVLFTPIAYNAALQLGVDPKMFIFAVIFASNCSFATPIGYQTNLLVMGPGHYSFSDFMRAGIPLALFVWITYSFFAPWYFGI